MKETVTETAVTVEKAKTEAFEGLARDLKAWWEKSGGNGNGQNGGSTGGLNRVVLAGNMTRDPQLRKLPSGMAVADLGLATSETRKNKSGENVDVVCFVDIVTWGRQAETCAQYLKKGSPVLVEGRLQFDRWEAKTGEKRSKLRVRADSVKFLPRSHAQNGQENGGGNGNGGNGNGNGANGHAAEPALCGVADGPGDEDGNGMPF